MHRNTSALVAGVATLAAAVLALSACTAQTPAPVLVAADAPPDVGVELFELPWTSIAQECENTVGPNGFAWVLTSPPQEHITGDQWWSSYQPVSYRLDSKLGTRDEFADMVKRCSAVGVKVIADAVINHMTAQDAAGTGFAGTAFDHDDYPGLYGPADFHHCGMTPDDDIEDSSSRSQMQTCELLGLADLDTSSPHVQETIDAYLEDLLSLGVAGFRIDAATNIPAVDLEAIVDRLPDDTVIMSEAIRGDASDPIEPEEYTGIGDVLEYQYARDLGPQVSSGYLADPALSDPRPSHVPAASAVVFVDDHDTERADAAVTYRDGELYLIANVLMLADDYGTPLVYSGYAFTSRDAGPPSSADGTVLPASCDGVTGPLASPTDGTRICTQAWSAIAGMLEWRSAVGDAPRLTASKGGDLYGFEREGRGLVAVNPTGSEGWVIVPTSMPDGDYCDVITGGRDAAADGTCTGRMYDVNNGSVTFHLDAMTAAAIHLGSRLP